MTKDIQQGKAVGIYCNIVWTKEEGIVFICCSNPLHKFFHASDPPTFVQNLDEYHWKLESVKEEEANMRW